VVPLGVGLAGRIASMGQPLVVEDISETEIFSDVLRESGVVSMVGVPLTFHNGTTGVLHVGSRTRRQFSTEDVGLLRIVAERAVAAIERTMFLEAETDARREAEALSARLTVLQAVTAALG